MFTNKKQLIYFNDRNHPFHLHGYKFWIMAQGQGYFDHTKYGALSTKNLIKRDTVTICKSFLFPFYIYSTPYYIRTPLYHSTKTTNNTTAAFGWVLIRFYAKNPGLWAFHCKFLLFVPLILIIPRPYLTFVIAILPISFPSCNTTNDPYNSINRDTDCDITFI